MVNAAAAENILPQIGGAMFHQMRDRAYRYTGAGVTRMHVGSEHSSDGKSICRQQIEKILLRVFAIVPAIGPMTRIWIVNVFAGDYLPHVIQARDVRRG